jgi:hypothetical protein
MAVQKKHMALCLAARMQYDSRMKMKSQKPSRPYCLLYATAAIV